MVVHNNILAGASGATGTDDSYKISRSLRFNEPDSTSLSKTFTSAGNQKVWTLSLWVKRSTLAYGSLFSCYTGSNNDAGYFDMLFSGQDQISIGGWFTAYFRTARKFRDPSAWYHIVVAVDTTQSTSTNRFKVYVNGVQETVTDAYSVTQNQTFPINSANLHNIGANAYYTNATYRHKGYLADVHFIDGQALAPTDFGEFDDNNVWQPKEFTGSYTSTNTSTTLSQTGWTVSSPTSENTIWDGNTSTQSNGHNGGIIGTVSFSPALTNVTKVEVYQQNYVHYLNGSSVTTSQSGTGWHTLYDNSSSPITLSSVGNSYTNNTQTVDIMAIRINDSIVDSKTWTPPSGVGVQSSGANSFYLKFADNSSSAALGTDSSGNSNTWTVNNLSVASGSGNDSLIDTPTNYDDGTNVGGNYCTINPLNNAASNTLSNGNLKVATTTGNYGLHVSNMATPLSGKWYAEVKLASGTATYATVGLVATDATYGSLNWPGGINGVCYYSPGGKKYKHVRELQKTGTRGSGTHQQRPTTTTKRPKQTYM